MTITDKEFIQRVCEKAGIETFEYKCDMCENLSIRNRHCPRIGGFCFNWDVLDYNILMTAVENINDDTVTIINVPYWGCEVGDRHFSKRDYNNSMLLALQHALLYIMENEK